MDDSAGSSDVIRRLDRIAAWVRPDDDRLLTFLGIAGRGGLGVAVGMIVDGVMLFGAIGPQRGTEEALWDATRDAIQESDTPKDVREVLEASWQLMLERDQTRLADEDRLMDRYEPGVEIDDIDINDVYSLHRMIGTDVLDLHDVQMHMGAGWDPIEISAMRVRLSSVSAWWPLKSQGVNVHYTKSSAD